MKTVYLDISGCLALALLNKRNIYIGLYYLTESVLQIEKLLPTVTQNFVHYTFNNDTVCYLVHIGV